MATRRWDELANGFATHPDFQYQPIAEPRSWATAVGSNGYRAGSYISNAGFNNPQTFTQDFVYTLVPEPSSLTLVGLAAAGLLGFRRRK